MPYISPDELDFRRQWTERFAKVRQFIKAADVRQIVADLGNTTVGTVNQVRKGTRFNLEIIKKLIKAGEENAANFQPPPATLNEPAPEKGMTPPKAKSRLKSKKKG